MLGSVENTLASSPEGGKIAGERARQDRMEAEAKRLEGLLSKAQGGGDFSQPRAALTRQRTTLEEAVTESSPSPRVRASVRAVIEGFGNDRRPKPIELMAIEAFQEAVAAPPPNKEAVAPWPERARQQLAAGPSNRRVDSAIKSLRGSYPKRIDLSDDDALGDANIERLCSALLGHRALTELRLPRCGCGFTGASAVAELIAVHVHLTTVDLSRNEAIGDAGASALGRALRSSCRLTTLELRACGVGDEGAAAIATALSARRRQAPLAHLNLSFNPAIGTDGVDALRQAAAQCSGGKLRRIDLAGVSATAGQLAACQHALTAVGRAHPDGPTLWQEGLHTAFTMRFADGVDALRDSDAYLALLHPESAQTPARPQVSQASQPPPSQPPQSEPPLSQPLVSSPTPPPDKAADRYDDAVVQAMVSQGVSVETAEAGAAKARAAAEAAAAEAEQAEKARREAEALAAERRALEDAEPSRVTYVEQGGWREEEENAGKNAGGGGGGG